MSGSGGGGGGGGGTGGPTPCSDLKFETSLSSPQSAVVSTINVGDILDVVAKSATGPALAKTESEEVAGSITAGQLLRLLECLAEGNPFEAEVLGVSGGDVRVEVRPA